MTSMSSENKNIKPNIDKALFDNSSLLEIQENIKSATAIAEDERVKINEIAATITLNDTNSIIFFGSKAQERLTTISDDMLEGVRNKDTGSAGDALNEMISMLRGFDADDLEDSGFFARLLGRTKPVVKFIQRYETVRKQIDDITDNLEKHKTNLLTDVVSLDRLYNANLEYFHDLELYIAAGKEKLRELDQEIIPSLEQITTTSDDVLKAQELRDLRSARDNLERRVHDLLLTRQVTLQSLPSIRIVQENDKGLITKINSTMVNTIPLWRQQLATAVTIFRSSEASKAVKNANDLTNELLQKNAEMLKDANAEARRQSERGVFDIDVIHKANLTLIDTIEESLQIADEGKRLRNEAVIKLQHCETELKETLAAANAKSSN